MLVRKITIPNRDNAGWLHGTKEVLIDWSCPTCNKEMGEPKKQNFCEDGEWYVVDIWSNLCGHNSKYKDLKIVFN